MIYVSFFQKFVNRKIDIYTDQQLVFIIFLKSIRHIHNVHMYGFNGITHVYIETNEVELLSKRH